MSCKNSAPLRPAGFFTFDVTVLGVLLGAILFALFGCTHNAAALRKSEQQQDERTREHIGAARAANAIGAQRLAVASGVAEAVPVTAESSNSLAVLRAHLVKTAEAVNLSDDFSRRAQNLIGPPTNDQTKVVQGLLSTNEMLRAQLQFAEDAREAQERQWISREATARAALEAMGAKYEAERNTHIVRRIWAWSISTLGIGGLIALCIFCPAAIPIVMRVIAWIVAKVPHAAGLIGVVSHKAFDAVVKGVGEVKVKLEANKDKTYTGAEALALFRNELSAATDKDHKDLIDARRSALNAG